MPKDLKAFFYPQSVAVVGASRNPQKVGAIVLKNIIDSGYQGKIYPVNPNSDTLGNLKCYSSCSELPEIPDLVILAVPAEFLKDVVIDAGEKGLKNLVVFAAGFKETGEGGAMLEKELIEIAKKYQLNLLGPNCLGFINTEALLNATFSEPSMAVGNLRFISQSGAIASSLFDWCGSMGLGFREFVTLGNKAVINENDILEYFLENSQQVLSEQSLEGMSRVQPIGLYLESISDGPGFLKLTSQITKNDPVFIIKPGKTQAAVRAMQSHTGAIAGEDPVLEAVLKQAGVIRCDTLEDFFDLARAFSWEDALSGSKVAVISNAGGPGVISADAIVNEGLELAELDQETKNKLLEILPRSASIYNPVDVLGDALAERFAQAAEVVLQTEMINALLVILTPQVMTQIAKTAELIGALANKYQTPIFCSFIGGAMVGEGEKILNSYKIPSFRFPERAIKAMAAMRRFRQGCQVEHLQSVAPQAEVVIDEVKIKTTIQIATNNEYKTLDNFDANDVLSSVGIPTPPTFLAVTIEEAREFAEKVGWPVVLKLSSPGLLHKKDVGGVILDIKDAYQLEDAWNTLTRKISELGESNRSLVKIQIQKSVAEGVEVLVGFKRDPTFGPVLLFGAGGTYAELISDRNLLLLPTDQEKIKNLVEKSKVYEILKGGMHEPAYALDKLCDLIYRFSLLAKHVPEATDIEINPVIVTLNDVWAVDGKLILKGDSISSVAGPKFKVAKTIYHENVASTYHHFRFEARDQLEFLPGQYITVKVATNAVRAYSIAGKDDQNRFDLFVDIKPGGPGSKFFEHLKVGDKITYLGPFGVFTLKKDDQSKHLLFLGTGSGCSPLRSMIDAVLAKEDSGKTVTLYIGLNHTEDLFWQDYLQRLEQTHPNFKFKIAVFDPDEKWQGHKGYITELVKQDFPDASDCSAYLCGSKPMIDSATKLLEESGCPPERIYLEKL